MKPITRKRTSFYNRNVPIFVEKGEDGFYVVSCPFLEGCYTQGKTLDEALRNIREAAALILEERDARAALRAYQPEELSIHTIRI